MGYMGISCSIDSVISFLIKTERDFKFIIPQKCSIKKTKVFLLLFYYKKVYFRTTPVMKCQRFMLIFCNDYPFLTDIIKW